MTMAQRIHRATDRRVAKISVSLAGADLAVVRRRAKRLYRGNLSAALADGVRRLREEEGREALAAWLEERVATTQRDLDVVRAEWRGVLAARKRRKSP